MIYVGKRVWSRTMLILIYCPLWYVLEEAFCRFFIFKTHLLSRFYEFIFHTFEKHALVFVLRAAWIFIWVSSAKFTCVYSSRCFVRASQCFLEMNDTVDQIVIPLPIFVLSRFPTRSYLCEAEAALLWVLLRIFFSVAYFLGYKVVCFVWYFMPLYNCVLLIFAPLFSFVIHHHVGLLSLAKYPLS